MTTFEELYAACFPLIEAFHDDLVKHDREWLENNPGSAFLHYTRACGTWLIPLPESDDLPPEGEKVRYLFGHAGREHILRQTKILADKFVDDAIRGETPQRAVHWFDGKKLRRVDVQKAQQVAREHVYRIEREWYAVVQERQRHSDEMSRLRHARLEAASRNAAQFGTDPSWYGVA